MPEEHEDDYTNVIFAGSIALLALLVSFAIFAAMKMATEEPTPEQIEALEEAHEKISKLYNEGETLRVPPWSRGRTMEGLCRHDRRDMEQWCGGPFRLHVDSGQIVCAKYLDNQQEE